MRTRSEMMVSSSCRCGGSGKFIRASALVAATRGSMSGASTTFSSAGWAILSGCPELPRLPLRSPDRVFKENDPNPRDGR
eukprot:CAMPEP_0204287124 /NCGR_PEP_ID=MMETSP0468-20130131/54079_1 /ASSEMBLY_ACC=CAM_ASM_000383 /TAXON_ID=2969 /ORGANISM="Oxyrrhis marina" /LENGTH=79 /DNA_ID=CAMNT_0051265081 /DNA_START=106 /DNA_END=342 /DNA_ORIENTATION=-